MLHITSVGPTGKDDHASLHTLPGRTPASVRRFHGGKLLVSSSVLISSARFSACLNWSISDTCIHSRTSWLCCLVPQLPFPLHLVCRPRASFLQECGDQLLITVVPFQDIAIQYQRCTPAISFPGVVFARTFVTVPVPVILLLLSACFCSLCARRSLGMVSYLPFGVGHFVNVSTLRRRCLRVSLCST